MSSPELVNEMRHSPLEDYCTISSLALAYTKLKTGKCLAHIGREGDGLTAPHQSNRRSMSQRISTNTAKKRQPSMRILKGFMTKLKVGKSLTHIGREGIVSKSDPNKMRPTYWQKRQNYQYYKKVIEIVNRINPTSLLDVGTGPTLYLNEFQIPLITALDVVYREEWNSFNANIAKKFVPDFPHTVPVFPHEVVTCLQCLEHVKEKPLFIQTLFSLAQKWLIVSLPYKWHSKRKTTGQHNYINKEVIVLWFGCQPTEQYIITEPSAKQRQRIISVWNIGSSPKRVGDFRNLSMK